MRPKRLTFTLAAADDNGYLDDATGAGPFTTILAQPGDGCGHPVTITSTANLSTINLTVTGTDAEDRSISELIAGPNNSTVTTAKYFKTVTSITASATLGANTMDVGWTALAVTPIYPLNYYSTSGAIMAVDIGGTVTFTGQGTNGNIFALAESELYFEGITGMTAATADAVVQVATGTTGVRVSVASHTSGTLAITYTQGV